MSGSATGFMAAFVFLGINGLDLLAEESDVVRRTLAAAANEMSEKAYASWLEENSRGGKGAEAMSPITSKPASQGRMKTSHF